MKFIGINSFLLSFLNDFDENLYEQIISPESFVVYRSWKKNPSMKDCKFNLDF